MTAAFIEHRPRASDPREETTHYAVVVEGKETRDFKTQKMAADWAKAQGHTVHVARVRHLQNKDIPDHWRQYA
jgi:hypothetical protein